MRNERTTQEKQLLAETSDGLIKRSRRRSLAVVGEFSMIEIALVDDEIRV